GREARNHAAEGRILRVDIALRRLMPLTLPLPARGERAGVRGACALSGLAFLGSIVFASPARAERFAADTFFLDNGMQVVVAPNHRVPAVTQMVWYKVGAADDPLGKSGLAHFLEHLMFKGTKATPPGAFAKLIGREGGRDNAFTTEDYTAYHETVARDRLELAMQLE